MSFFWAVGPILDAYLKLSIHCQNISSIGLFCRFYFETISCGSATHKSGLDEHSVIIPRCYKDIPE